MTQPPEKQDPRLSRVLPANVDAREMAYRLRRLVEAHHRVSFIRFNAVSFRTLVVVAVDEAENTVAQRMARAVHVTTEARAQASALHAPPPPPPRYLDPSVKASYFEGLRSQQPRTKTVIYFLKVDAQWPGGFGFIHLRVRTVPLARTPLGVPSSIPPLCDGNLVVEGILPMGTSPTTTLEPFAATMSQPLQGPTDHAARLARQRR